MERAALLALGRLFVQPAALAYMFYDLFTGQKVNLLPWTRPTWWQPVLITAGAGLLLRLVMLLMLLDVACDFGKGLKAWSDGAPSRRRCRWGCRRRRARRSTS